MPRDLPTVQQEGLEDALRTPAPENRLWKVEPYRTPPPGYYYPPNQIGRVGITWPTGFAGGGYLVRDAAGEVVFASAWRVDCLEFVDEMIAKRTRRAFVVQVLSNGKWRKVRGPEGGPWDTVGRAQRIADGRERADRRSSSTEGLPHRVVEIVEVTS